MLTTKAVSCNIVSVSTPNTTVNDQAVASAAVRMSKVYVGRSVSNNVHKNRNSFTIPVRYVLLLCWPEDPIWGRRTSVVRYYEISDH